jgi:mRNA-degrading endonuclease RelE of RelBE toxin-antitoxin system
MKVTFLKVAEAELNDAFKYYELVQSGLGFRFITGVEHAKTRIIKFPFSYEKIGQYSRRCLVHKFSYGIIYQYMEINKEILVVAVSHYIECQTIGQIENNNTPKVTVEHYHCLRENSYRGLAHFHISNVSPCFNRYAR